MRLIDKLDITVRDLISYISSLSSAQLAFSTTEKWGARETFIHIVFWHEQYVGITQSIIKKEKPNYLRGTFKEHNALAVKMNREVPIDKLADRLQKAQAELVRLFEDAKECRLLLEKGAR